MSTVRHVGRILSAWGFTAAIALATISIFVDYSSVSQTANNLAYDHFVRLDSKFSMIPADVLLVYADADLDQHPELYNDLLVRLHRMGAMGVGIAQLDARNWTAEQLGQLANWKGLVVGHVDGEVGRLPDGLARGSITLIDGPDGVYRRYDGMSSEPGTSSLAAQVAQTFGPTSVEIPLQAYGVRFCGSIESLPHVSADRVLSGEITAALVRDRYVLIGRPLSAGAAGLATPTTGTRRMSVLEFHGHALNTIIATRPISTISQRQRWVLYLLAALLFPGLGRRVRLSFSTPMFLVAWSVQALIAWLLLWRLQLWIPLASLTLVEAIASLWCLDQRLHYSELAWQVLRRRGFGVSPRYQNPPSLNAAEPPWTYITTMLQQLFPLDNVALLLAKSTRERLEQVACTGERSAEAVDRRRDLGRRPFAEAIRRRISVRIDRDRPFFQTSGDQVQYFVPLFHAGQLRGILIVELSSRADTKLSGFGRQLTDVGEEIAGWLARYQRLSTAAKRRRRWWYRLATPSETTTFERLEDQFRTVERRIHQADQVVENASFGRAVFDLSGGVVTINAMMYRLLHASNISTTDTRLLQILRGLTKRGASECRELFRRVVMHQQRERIVVTSPTDGQPMVLVIQPVLRSEQMAADPTELQAFNVQGIHIEVFPGDLLGDIHDVFEHVAEQTLVAVHDTLADLATLTSEHEAATSPEAWKRIVTTVDRARVTVQRCQSMLANGQSTEVDVRVPVEIGAMVRSAVAEARTVAEHRNTSVTVDSSRDLPDVVANPHRLRQVLSTAISVMIEHARENSLISISARTDQDRVVVTIENEGCGVALDRFASNARGLSTEPPTEVSRLIQLRDWLVVWGGDLTVDAELGEGASVRLSLSHFDWSGASEAVATDWPSQIPPTASQCST